MCVSLYMCALMMCSVSCVCEECIIHTKDAHKKDRESAEKMCVIVYDSCGNDDRGLRGGTRGGSTVEQPEKGCVHLDVLLAHISFCARTKVVLLTCKYSVKMLLRSPRAAARARVRAAFDK